MQSTVHFYMLATAVDFVQGGSQAISRTIFGSMVPVKRTAEFFGFYGISSKFSDILGPFVFGLVGQYANPLSLNLTCMFYILRL